LWVLWPSAIMTVERKGNRPRREVIIRHGAAALFPMMQ
jgi:hypothetical protein